MQAIVWRHQVTDPARREEVIRRVLEGLVPSLNDLPGIEDIFVIACGTGGITCIASFAETDQAAFGAELAKGWISWSLMPLLAGPIEIESGSVSAHRRTGPEPV